MKNKIIISDEENNDKIDTLDETVDAHEAYKPHFSKQADHRIKDMPYNDDTDDEDDEYEYDDEDDDDEEDDNEEDYDELFGYYLQAVRRSRNLLIAGFVIGTIVIAIVFLIIGIYIGRNSSSAFIDHFDLQKESGYIDVIED